MQENQTIFAGTPFKEAKKVLIMLHGWGGSAEDILSLSDRLKVGGYALVAPQAANNSWYPLTFMAPPSQNEPALTSSIRTIGDLVTRASANGISRKNIFFLGFSQGACLALEFTARHAVRYGGIIAFTGGLIGDKLYTGNYKGDFDNTPVFIGSADPDSHVPIERVHATTLLFRSMHARVTEKIYDHMGHTINEDEIQEANRLIFLQSE
jgi:phospholipase/carboxylesterase